MKNVSLLPMTRQMCHEFYKEFQNDPAIGHYYEFTYTPQWADDYFDRNSTPDRRLFAILADGKIVGECKLKDIDFEVRECSMGIHLQNDSVKGKGYGTQAERLVLTYAFEDLGMAAVNADAALGNTRSQHVLEKVGFSYTGEDDTFQYYRCENPARRECIRNIRAAEAVSHTKVYEDHALFTSGSWLAKPVKTVMELLPLFEGYTQFKALDLGCGVGRNCIPVAQRFDTIPCQVDCVDILELALEKLRENAEKFHVQEHIRTVHSAIDDYEIPKEAYDLILAVSALEHVGSRRIFAQKLMQIRDGLRTGGIACLIVNSGVVERDKATAEERMPQFEVNLPTDEMRDLLERTFIGWEVLKHTLVHQKYDIPRETYIAALETDVLTWVVRKKSNG